MDQLKGALDQIEAAGYTVTALRADLAKLDVKFNRLNQLQAEAQKLQEEAETLSGEFTTEMDSFSAKMQQVMEGAPGGGGEEPSGSGGDEGGSTPGMPTGMPTGMGGGVGGMPGNMPHPVDMWKQSLQGARAAGVDVSGLESEIETLRPKYDEMMKLNQEVQQAAMKGQAPAPDVQQRSIRLSQEWASASMAMGQKIQEAVMKASGS